MDEPTIPKPIPVSSNIDNNTKVFIIILTIYIKSAKYYLDGSLLDNSFFILYTN